MKSNQFIIGDKSHTSAILTEAVQFATDNGLSLKQGETLRLLAEEMLSLVESLIQKTGGEFWFEAVDSTFELHLRAQSSYVSQKQKETLIEVSTDKKNLSAKNFLGKLRAIFEAYLDESSNASFSITTDALGNFTTMPIWSMIEFQNRMPKEELAKWDGLEKSFLEKFADDILVGAQNSLVQLIVKKTFEKGE